MSGPRGRNPSQHEKFYLQTISNILKSVHFRGTPWNSFLLRIMFSTVKVDFRTIHLEFTTKKHKFSISGARTFRCRKKKSRSEQKIAIFGRVKTPFLYSNIKMCTKIHECTKKFSTLARQSAIIQNLITSIILKQTF